MIRCSASLNWFEQAPRALQVRFGLPDRGLVVERVDANEQVARPDHPAIHEGRRNLDHPARDLRAKIDLAPGNDAPEEPSVRLDIRNRCRNGLDGPHPLGNRPRHGLRPRQDQKRDDADRQYDKCKRQKYFQENLELLIEGCVAAEHLHALHGLAPKIVDVLHGRASPPATSQSGNPSAASMRGVRVRMIRATCSGV
jgi:hypothetical protein